MKGAIHFKNVGTTEMSGLSFSENDPGPFLESAQRIGLTGKTNLDDNLRDISYIQVDRASAIYID